MRTKLLSLLFLLFAVNISYGQFGPKTGLLLVDYQDFYFPGGKSALVNPEPAVGNGAFLLGAFRAQNMSIVHVRHNFEPGGNIHVSVKPLESEKVVSKDEVNAFFNSDLHYYFKSRGVDTLIVCGMQTHMCAEAAARAAHDLGYVVYFVDDACATKDLKWDEYVISAEAVHKSTLATIRSYSKVVSTKDVIKLVEQNKLK